MRSSILILLTLNLSFVAYGGPAGPSRLRASRRENSSQHEASEGRANDIKSPINEGPTDTTGLDTPHESPLKNLPQKNLFNSTATAQVDNKINKVNKVADKCYKMLQQRDPLGYPVRGLQKTSRVLEAIAAKRDKVYSSLNVPRALLRHLQERDGQSRSQNLQETAELVRCPIAETIFPCTCEPVTAVINCSATGNFTRVREIFRTATFIDRSFERFLLYSLGDQVPSETVLRAGTFGPATFREAVIESTNLQAVEVGAFQGSESTLQLIQMEYNPQLRFFPFEDLHKFSELQEIKLSFGRIEGVQPLHTVPKLESIQLNANSIGYIDPYAFAFLPKLETLDLGSNHLTTIQAHDFAFSSPDVILYLDQNRISNIEDEAFSNEQPSLLDLYQNQMTTLNASVFQPILENIIQKQYDTYIGAEENPLCCLGVEWILQNPSYLNIVYLPTLDCYSLAGLEKNVYQ
ncbi:oplophorus-luciferin 2-monooxygenase non-catalytic subunit-like [Macrobrachium rosenbergii]|uniref:oplophorus-luciferin 2-monooxygenase non-catalytic subunit-like n=1 Tax=Macrobrachium rosenbergii TaxID=79674 RepID=UPI0034D4E89B